MSPLIKCKFHVYGDAAATVVVGAKLFGEQRDRLSDYLR